MIIHSKKLLNNSVTEQESIISPVTILGALPSDFYGTAYNLIKIDDEFYAINNSGANKGTATTDVQTLNFISKSADFKNWTGSGIGSGHTVYDEDSGYFFSITLGLNYSTNHAAYHVTKINPKTFEYKITTIMPPTALSQTSRYISQVQRIANYLVFYCVKGQTDTYVYYSSDNGETWSSKKLSTVSLGLGAFSYSIASDKTKALVNGYFGSTTSSVKCFTSPTAYKNSNCKICKSDRPGYSYGSNFYNYSSSDKTINLTTDFINYSKTLNVLSSSIGNQCFFYDKYIISTANSSYKLSSPPDDISYYGKITIYDKTNGEMHYFDPDLDIPYQSGSGDYIYVYNYIQIVGFIDEEIYFVFQCKTNRSYQLAKVPISYVIENMILHS